MNRRQFLASLAAAPLAGAQPARRPNILIFLVDDMGYADIGPYGVRDTRTPHLDELAKGGVRFTDSYSNGPVCTPTRCALLTGRYQQRYGLEWALTPATQQYGLSSKHVTLARMLKNRGYRTAIFGKWHLGHTPETMPLAHGFDVFFGITGGNVDHYTHKTRGGTHDLYEGNDLVHRKGYLTELLTDRTVEYIESHAKSRRDEPFFVYVPYNSVHWPFQPPGQPDERTNETWMTGSRADYVRMVESIDSSVGAILGALERNKLSDDTLVIFTNDNGGERFSRNEPAFHHKGTLWEGGILVPTIMRWPGRVPAGITSRQAMITMDLTATAVAAAGASAEAPLDGIDLIPIVTGREAEVERTLFWRIDRDDRKQKAVRKGNLKYIRDGNIELLFDLARDPSERRDIGLDRPKELAELRAAMARWESELAKNPPPFQVK